MPRKNHTNDSIVRIIDPDLYNELIRENQELREMLREVSAVGVSMMFHTHREDCSTFTRDFLKSIVSISHEIEVREVQSIYCKAYETATQPGALDAFDQHTQHEE